MNNGLRKVAVIGAAGFVGQFVCRRLAESGWQVYGAASERNSFLLDHLKIPAASGRYPVVVNLAYPTSVTPVRRKAENSAIVERISSLLAPGGTLLHTSTLAVFGFQLDRPVACGPIHWRPDADYVETKVRMELTLAEEFGGSHRVEIVRLGNVWGQGSPNWLVGLAVRLRDGLPVLVKGGQHSNVTEVQNVAAYLNHLANLSSSPTAGVRFHHLAEFSSVPWDPFVQMIAAKLGVDIQTAETPVAQPLKSLIVGTYVGETYKFLNRQRICGSLMRQALSMLPKTMVGSVRQSKKSLGKAMGDDETYYTVMGCSREFCSSTVPGWQPPVDLGTSLAGAAKWLEHAGFVTNIVG